MEFQKLGKYLQEKRIESGHTQAEHAAKLGDVHSQFVSNWERGLCAPPSHAFQDLIRVLKLDRQVLVEAMLMDSKSVIEKKVYKKKSSKKEQEIKVS